MTVACNLKTGECREVRNFITPKDREARILRKWNINKQKEVASPDSIEETKIDLESSDTLQLNGEIPAVEDSTI